MSESVQFFDWRCFASDDTAERWIVLENTIYHDPSNRLLQVRNICPILSREKRLPSITFSPLQTASRYIFQQCIVKQIGPKKSAYRYVYKPTEDLECNFELVDFTEELHCEE